MGCTLGAARQAKKEEKAEKAMLEREKPPDKGEENVLFEQPPVPAEEEGKDVTVNGGDTDTPTIVSLTDRDENIKNDRVDEKSPEGEEYGKQIEDVSLDSGKPVQESLASDTSDQDMVAEQNKAIAELERSVSEEAPPPPPPFMSEEEQKQKPPTPPPPYRPEEELPPPPPPPFGADVETESTEKTELVIEEPELAASGDNEQIKTEDAQYREVAQDVVKVAIEAGVEQMRLEQEAQPTEPETMAERSDQEHRVDGNLVVEMEGEPKEEKSEIEPQKEDMPSEVEPEQLADVEPQAEPKQDGDTNIFESAAETLATQIINDAITISTDQTKEYQPPTVEDYLGNFEQYQKCESAPTEYQPPSVEEYLANFEQYEKCESAPTEYQPPSVEEYLTNFEKYQKCESASTEYQPPSVEEYLTNFEKYQKCESASTEYQPPSVEEYLTNFEKYQKCESAPTEYQPPSVEEYLANFDQYQTSDKALMEYQPFTVEEYIANINQNQTCESVPTEYRPPTVEQYLLDFEHKQNEIITENQEDVAEQSVPDLDQTDSDIPKEFSPLDEQFSSLPQSNSPPFIEKESEL